MDKDVRKEKAGMVSAEFTSDKKAASNQRRLEALKRRQIARKQTISLVNTCPLSKHIVFTTDSEGDDGSSGGEWETCARMVGRQWLFSESSDSSEEEKEDVAQFAPRRQFEGTHGEKLFRLQQQIGTDHRFRVDERFAETSDEEHNESSDNSDNLEKEKEQSRRIIASLFGPAGVHSRSRENSPPLIRHYDPSLDDSADMEQETPVSKTNKLGLASASEDETATNAPPFPVVVSQESSSKVSSSLKELLSRGSVGNGAGEHTFNFFSSHREDSNDEEKEGGCGGELEINKFCPRWLAMAEDKVELENEEEVEGERDTQKPKLQPQSDHGQRVLFFFHSTDPYLRNRLQENSFYRCKPAKELMEKWSERRAAVKLAYKRSRKQALKRTKKRDWSH